MQKVLAACLDMSKLWARIALSEDWNEQDVGGGRGLPKLIQEFISMNKINLHRTGIRRLVFLGFVSRLPLLILNSTSGPDSVPTFQ